MQGVGVVDLEKYCLRAVYFLATNCFQTDLKVLRWLSIRLIQQGHKGKYKVELE